MHILFCWFQCVPLVPCLFFCVPHAIRRCCLSLLAVCVRVCVRMSAGGGEGSHAVLMVMYINTLYGSSVRACLKLAKIHVPHEGYYTYAGEARWSRHRGKRWVPLHSGPRLSCAPISVKLLKSPGPTGHIKDMNGEILCDRAETCSASKSTSIFCMPIYARIIFIYPGVYLSSVWSLYICVVVRWDILVYDCILAI